jgi:hypothetical protein
MRFIKRAYLSYLLANDESYLKACVKDGLLDSLSIADFEKRMQGLRVQIAALAPRLRRGSTGLVTRVNL